MKYRHTKPIPMPRGTHYGNSYFVFNSRKIGRRVTAFSNLEFDNLICLEMDPEVEYYCEQPETISLVVDGQEKESTFDVWVFYRNGEEEYQEVKYISEVNDKAPDSRTAQQIRIQQKWCKINGFKHVLRTDDSIYLGQYYLTNLRFLAAKTRRNIVPSDIQASTEKKIRSLLEERYCNVGGLIKNKILPGGMEIDSLAIMYFKGIIKFANIEDAIITDKTEVYLYE